jgi:aminopeptidase 2
MCYKSVAGSTNFNDRDVLPGNVKPTHYDVTIRPDMTKFIFTGTVKIE